MPKSGRLSRLGVLAPAALSACMDASVLVVPAAGAIVSTVLKELSKSFMLKKWFHGSMSAKEAESLMMEKGKNGSFLVRESKAHPGDFVLSVRVGGRVSHVMIRKQNNKYEVGSGEQFDDLVGLIEHFRSYPMIESSGDVLRLLQPVSGTRLRAADIATKLHEMQEMEELQECGKGGFEAEFQTLQLLDGQNVFTSDVGALPENANKNRYRNVLPYDQTRVVLRKRNDRPGGDYINASYIRPSRLCDSLSSVESSNESLDSILSSSAILRKEMKNSCPLISKSLSDEALKEVQSCFKLDKINGNLCNNPADDKIYIATQGCLSNTKEDFWRMVWQEDVRIIVMITNEYEKGKKKCERYWPQADEVEYYADLKVKSITENCYEDYLVREFDVSDDKKSVRTIYQYQFTAWPDHGIPTAAEGVLAFMSDINRRTSQIMLSKHRPEQNVVCVHCSAGVGRTGTFIVLDMIIDKINNSVNDNIGYPTTAHTYCARRHKVMYRTKRGSNCNVDVHGTVKLARAQRSGLVQNKAQYKFIYTALQLHMANNKRKPANRICSMEA